MSEETSTAAEESSGAAYARVTATLQQAVATALAGTGVFVPFGHESRATNRVVQELVAFHLVALREVVALFDAAANKPWPGERCRRCGHRNVIGFLVPDEAWQAVVRGRWNVTCPACFDEEAQLIGYAYSFIEVFAVTWRDWQTAEVQP